jgi:hypothetical protein
MYKYTKNIPMPSLSKENYPYNAKITEFLCDFCGTQSFARYKNAKYCSELCRHHAYLERKKNEEVEKRDYDVKVTQKSRENDVTAIYIEPEPSGIKIVGGYLVQKFFKDNGLKVTMRLIKSIQIGESQRVNKYEITRLNLKSWYIEK